MKVFEQGYELQFLKLPEHIRNCVEMRNWNALDQAISIETKPSGLVFEALQKYCSFQKIEFIISIRTSKIEPDEDGIWHDDGSRKLAFSLSLTPNPEQLEGGVLEIRRRIHPPLPSVNIPTPLLGTLIVFATGQQGFEHKINRVTQGERIIIAGWCT
jgi:hypothetical protein